MPYRVEFTNRALQDFGKLDHRRRKALMDAAEGLGADPHPSNSKRLRGSLREYHRIRVEDDRAIYFVDEKAKEVLVVAAGPRGRIYEVTRRRL